MQEILIKNIMTALVQCASPSTPLSHVIQSMKLSHHSCAQVSGFLTEAVRKSDRVYRYGGRNTRAATGHFAIRRSRRCGDCRFLEPHSLKVLSGGVSSPHDKVAEDLAQHLRRDQLGASPIASIG